MALHTIFLATIVVLTAPVAEPDIPYPWASDADLSSNATEESLTIYRYSVPRRSVPEEPKKSVHKHHTDKRISVRIGPPPVRGSSFTSSGQRVPRVHIRERKIGKCIDARSIASVRSVERDRLVLYTRDNHLISALLEKNCRADSYYMGFYLTPNKDGKLCVSRDTLLARSGASCKITEIRQLLPEK